MKRVETEMNDELRAEYDLRTLRVRKVGPRRKTFKTRYEMVESLRKKYFEIFSGVTDLDAVWQEATDPKMMLDMLRESNYEQDYCPELITFIKHTEGLTGETYGDHGALTPSECQSNRRQFDLLLMRAEIAIGKVIVSAKDDDFWKKRMPRHTIEGAHWSEEAMNKILGEKLRKLIPCPFLHKTD